MQRFSMGGLGGRFVVALVLVMATYNPSGYSLLGWVAGSFPPPSFGWHRVGG